MFCATVTQRKGPLHISIGSVIQRNGSIVGNMCLDAKYNLYVNSFFCSDFFFIDEKQQ